MLFGGIMFFAVLVFSTLFNVFQVRAAKETADVEECHFTTM